MTDNKKPYTVFGKAPEGNAGDGLFVSAEDRSEAQALFLKAHPGWSVTSVHEGGVIR